MVIRSTCDTSAKQEICSVEGKAQDQTMSPTTQDKHDRTTLQVVHDVKDSLLFKRVFNQPRRHGGIQDATVKV